MGTISRVTTWSTGDTLTASDLNGEFDNILSTANGSLNADNLGVTAGQAAASKAIVLDSNKDFANATGSNQIRNLTLSGSLKIGTTFLPDAAGGADLGSTSLEWGDVYVADDKYLYMGSDQNIKIGYDETTTDSLAISAIEGADLAITLRADEGDDAGDEWKLNVADGGVITLGNDIASAGTFVTHLTLTPHATVSSSTLALAGALTVAGTAAITGVATVGGLTIGSAAINEAELETIDGITAGTVAASKAVVVDSNKDIGTFRNITLDGTLSDGNYTFDTSGNVSGLGTVGSGAITSTGVVTGTGFTIGSAAINEAELETIDGVTAGTVTASKAVVVDSNKDIGTFRNITLDGTLSDGNYTFDTSGNVAGLGTIGSGAITSSGIIKTDDATEATTTTDGSLQTDGGLSVVKDAIFGDDVRLLSDSAVLALGAGNDATLTHDGTTGVTIAANPVIIDSGDALTLDAHTGIHIFKDAGTEVLRFTEGNSGDVTVKLATNGKDLIFTDHGDATGLKVLDAAAGINVPGEVQTTKIAYTDGDDAITIADGGGITTAGTLATTGAATLASLVCTAGATFGGGYGSTGVTISTAGVLQANGAITSDGAVTGATLAGTISTAAQNSITSASSLATVGTITSGTWSGVIDGSATMTLGSDATGDVYYRDSSGFLERLGVGSDGQVLTSTGTLPNWEDAGGGSGDFSGPGSATDNAVVRFDGTGGKTGQNSGLIIDDSNNVTGAANVTLSGELDAATGDFSGIIDVAGAATLASLVCTAGGTFGGGTGSTGATIDTDGVGTFDGVLTGLTVEATGDTAAGDNAAMGYTSAEGLILTGQGSTSDVTIKNDADATVMSIPTGTTKVGIGTTASQCPLHVHGAYLDPNTQINSSGAFFTSSTALAANKGGVLQFGGIYNSGGDITQFSTIQGLKENATDGDADGYLSFITRGSNIAERMRIDSAGNVIIGGTAAHDATTVLTMRGAEPAFVLQDTASSTSNWDFSSSSAGGVTWLNLSESVNSKQWMRVQSTTGYVAIPSGIPAHQLDVTGTAGLSTGTAWTDTSDSRIKTNVQTITGALDRIKQLRPISFQYTDLYLSVHDEIDGSKTYHSFLAEEYETVFPDAVSTRGDLVKITPMVKAKEAQAAVAAQDAILYTDDDELPEGVSVGDVRVPAVEATEAVAAVERQEEIHESLMQDLKAYTPHDLHMFLVAAVQELEAKVATLEAA